MNLEDRWFQFLDALDERGIPVYSVIEPIEEKGIPSLALTVGIIVIIIFLVVFVLMPGQKVNLIVNTNEGASVSVSFDDKKMISIAENGTVFFKIPIRKSVKVRITKIGCNSTSVELDLLDDYTLERNLVC